MLKGKGKTTGLVQKNSRSVLSNSDNNKRTLLVKAQDAILDLKKTKGQFETYGQNRDNFSAGVKLEGGKEKKATNMLARDTIKKLKENNHVELDKIILTEKESQRKTASNQIQAELPPVAKTLQQQKVAAKTKTQLVKLKKLTSIKTNKGAKLEQKILIKPLGKQSQHVQADLHATLEAGLAAGKIKSVVPSYI